jgi:hypothetical protein
MVLNFGASYMRPNTPHYVVTLEDAITLGRHFYAMSTIKESIFASIHCAILNSALTNADCPESYGLLRRILIMTIGKYMQGVTGYQRKPYNVLNP